MRTIVWFIWFWVQLAVLQPLQRKGKKALQAGDDAAVDALVEKMVPKWAGDLLRLAGVTVEVTGKDNIPTDTPCVFVGNHRSYYDIPLVLTCLDKPHPLVAKKELARLPLVKGWMELLRCVFIDRDNPRQAMQAMNQAMENLKKGYSVTIFPEGTRGKGSELELGEFKAGAFRIATKTKSPVVPLAIHGSRDIMENNGGWMKPTHVTIRILPSIPTDGLSREQLRQLPEQTADIILENLRQMQETA